MARQSETRRARRGTVWRGTAWRGAAWHSVARRGMARQAHRSTHEGKRGTEVVGNHPAARVIASLRRSAAIVLVSFPPPPAAPPRRPYCQHPLLRSLPIPRNVFHPSIHPPSSSTIPCRFAIFSLSFSDLMLA